MTNGCMFKVGDAVRRRSAPDSVGLVKHVSWDDQAEECRYRVQFGAHLKSVPEGDLELLPDTKDLAQDLLDGRVEGAANFQRLLTFERLRRPPSRLATSFGVARAKLLPYQFKPLLKFLENPSQRLLIADDVGLGKTIEAGYILKELRSRQQIERVLIVAPARLRTKWKSELERRFDERFDIVRAADFRGGLLERMARDAEPEPFSWIISYESIRLPDIAKGLNAYQPGIDLVVLDEAHRVRNPSDQQRVAVSLGKCANAMVFLTATPIQTSREDLFQLLKLLEPSTFSRFDVFERQLRANRPVVRALNAIRRNPPGFDDARSELHLLRSNHLTSSLAASPFVSSILERLDGRPTERQAIVDLQRDITELGLTSQILSRTRKVEVVADRPQRKAQAIKVKLTPEERAVYDSVVFLLVLINPTSSGWGASMGAFTALRYTASCIPAALEYLKSKVGDSLDAIAREAEKLTDDGDDGEDSEDRSPKETSASFWTKMQRTLETPITFDSKFDQFWRALQGVWQDDASAGRLPRKVVVFSFFKRTIGYLSGRLKDLSIEHRVISGDQHIVDRETRIDEFLNAASIRVLVSSEVGSEGLDLQAASVVVNYDLPWNPMVVEQRIGRVDRIGQESSVISILSLVLENTIEDRILYRLYERIGLFEETIGEIEPILGSQVQQLVEDALRASLSPDEQERRADETAKALLHQQEDAKDLREAADQLIAGDQAFLDEINGLMGERRIPAASELLRFLRTFIETRYPGSTFPGKVVDEVAEVSLQPHAASDLLNKLPGDGDVRRFASKIQSGPFLASFNADAHLRRPRSELLSAHHPLLRFATTELAGREDGLHRTFALCVRNSELDTGWYVMAIQEFEIAGVQTRVELKPLMWRIGARAPVPNDIAQATFVRLLDGGEDCEDELPSPSEMGLAIELLQRHTAATRARLRESELSLGRIRSDRRKATQLATLESRVRMKQERLGNLRQAGAADFPVRMAIAMLEQERAILDGFRSQPEGLAPVRIEDREVALAIVNVLSGRVVA